MRDSGYIKKVFVYFFVLSVILIIPCRVVALEVFTSQDTLSLRADKVPLQQILRRIAIQQNIRIKIDPNINPQITADFEKQDIQYALDKLIRPFSYALLWEKKKGSPHPGYYLFEIRIFEAGKSDRSKPLDTQEALEVAVSEETDALYAANEFLLKVSKELDEKSFRRILKPFDGRIISVHRGTGVFRIRVGLGTNIFEVIDKLSKQPEVANAEPNWVYQLPSMVMLTESESSIDTLTDASAPDGDIPIAVLDSGLNPDAGLADFVISSIDILQPDGTISDETGHGTQMALIASGMVAPYGALDREKKNNQVVPIRMFDKNGNTSAFHIMESIDFALKSGARVFSLSWGSPSKSDFLENAFNAAQASGMIIVAAAGNEATGIPVYPAAYPSVIGIGALDHKGKRWEKSNYGEFVNIYAPGIANLPIGYNGPPGIYAGTSISTAYTAYLISRYLSKHPGASLKEIFDNLKKK